jgi:hypothetical protein
MAAHQRQSRDARKLTVCQGADLTRWQDGQRSSGRLWQRVKRRDRSLGPASAVRGAPGELPGRTLAAGRALAGRGLGYQGKWGSVALGRGLTSRHCLPGTESGILPQHE